jgi:hypothetical protein
VCDNFRINVKQVKVFETSTNPNFLLTFLNNGLRNVMERMKYMEIGRTGKYFNRNEKKTLDNLTMFNGFKANFVRL